MAESHSHSSSHAHSRDEYLLFSDQDFYKGVPPGAHLQFSGTLVDFEYQDSAKPRKLTMKVKASSVERLQ